VRGKGNLSDGLSRLLTDVSQGYFQPDVGGKNIPVAQGELSDLAGDEPLFKALFKWCAARRACGLGGGRLCVRAPPPPPLLGCTSLAASIPWRLRTL